MGRQRFSLFVCMTCMGTAERHSTWEDDPASCLGRYTEKYQMRWNRPSDERRLFADELRAIAMLVEAHREQFDQLVADLGSVESMSDLRAKRRYAR